MLRLLSIVKKKDFYKEKVGLDSSTSTTIRCVTGLASNENMESFAAFVKNLEKSDITDTHIKKSAQT